MPNQNSIADSIIRIAILMPCIGLVTLSCSETFALCVKRDAETRPNVILVMADDLGINEVGCYGCKELKTPNIDTLCREGIKFTRAYSGSTVCAPARCNLMTGQHVGKCSVRCNSGGVALPADDVTMAEMFKSLGYATGGFGKWALGTKGSVGDPLNQGFDEFYGYYHQTHAHSHYPEYLINNSKPFRIEGNVGADFGYEQNGFVKEKNPATGKPLVYAPYLIMDAAEDFIRRNANEPFFCYLPVTAPHGHFLIPESDQATEGIEDKPWSDRAKAVGAMIQMLDRQVGDIVTLLQELKIDNNTILIFCSDHGAALRFDGELDGSGKYRGAKRSMYEGGLKIPLIVHWPARIEGGRESKHLMYLGDLFSTFMELCADRDQQKELDAMLRHQEMDSVSIAPTLLDRPKQKRHDFLFWEFGMYNPESDVWKQKMQAIRTEQWKLLRGKENQPWELYDMHADPFETKNVADLYESKVSSLEKLFFDNRSEPMRQQEILVDWMTPFTWENRNRFQRRPIPSVESVIEDSKPEFRGVPFDADAVMLGMEVVRENSGLIHVNIAWELMKGRRGQRFIHICDKTGTIVRQVGNNKDLFQKAKGNCRIVDSFVLTPKHTEFAAAVAVGFYDAKSGAASVTDPRTKKKSFRLEVIDLSMQIQN